MFLKTGAGTVEGVPADGGSEHFYREGGARRIMSVANFPDEILSFLQMEGLTVLDVASRHRCDSLVELGCYDGRALEVAKVANMSYVGVDVNSVAIGSLSGRIAYEGLGEWARAVLGSIRVSEDWVPEVRGERPLLLLPFNLIGNLDEPAKFLAELGGVGRLGVISFFNDDAWTTEVRRAYYTACGIAIHEEGPGTHGGTLFRGDGGFRSQSFSVRGMQSLLEAAGATLVHETSNRLGCCIAVRFSSVPSGARA
ncbi:hypothetical protein ABZY44_13130 [Streptomyces sp. NPDC006544]|uniref:hypothetical protein n=1 Tax=Streptomyces sp. NPDC006544 TaxID=3154583 RepID=UPI0033A565AE